MNKILYLECNAGISGDMTVAALLDLGADETVLRKTLDSIPLDGFQIEIGRVKKAGIDCCDFNVILDHIHENHDHDMAYLHGTEGDEEKEQGHLHHHGESGYHAGNEHHAENEHHGHCHDEEPHHHGVGMTYIRNVLENTDMTAHARKIAYRIFDIIAHAEAEAHGMTIEEIHFHEVGAVDSIVDIVSVAVCLDDLGIQNVIVPKLCEGVGTVRCQHGVLPVPVPAVVNIVREHNIKMEITGIQGEFVTPTGAAIVAAIRTSDRLPECFMIRRIGLGAGKRNYERPGILRAMLIEDETSETDTGAVCKDPGSIYKLESNIDDCSGEVLGYTMERLFAAGARDVHYHPVYMKKNRPGWQLNVICDACDVDKLEDIIFNETTTIGIRRMKLERSILERESAVVDTPYGVARVKVCILPDGRRRCYPEYDSLAEICRMQGIAYSEAYQLVRDTYDRINVNQTIHQ